MKFTTRGEFRTWLERNHAKETECWLACKKGKGECDGAVRYLDAVEEALCFGWIDTTHKNVGGVDLQKFTPRAKKSPWSELNKERVRRLEKLGLMVDSGRAVLPDMSERGFEIDSEIAEALAAKPAAKTFFESCPALYQKVRIDCIQRDKFKDRAVFLKRLEKLVSESAKGKMFGAWNDDGRLLDY